MNTFDILNPEYRPAAWTEKQFHCWRASLLSCQRALSPLRYSIGVANITRIAEITRRQVND